MKSSEKLSITYNLQLIYPPFIKVNKIKQKYKILIWHTCLVWKPKISTKGSTIRYYYNDKTY